MELICRSLSKRFTSSRWIIKDLNLLFKSGHRYGIFGANGSGKSSLISMLAGITIPSKGEVYYQLNEKNIPPIDWHRHISIATPYADLFEYLSPKELIEFHLSFKKFRNNISIHDFLEITNFHTQKDQLIKTFSSGMKQRLKLGLALLTKAEIIFLDEPRTNLDDSVQKWFEECLHEYTKESIVVIASNDSEDFSLVEEKIIL